MQALFRHLPAASGLLTVCCTLHLQAMLLLLHTCVHGRCKNVAAYNSAFGPVHDWVVRKLAHGGPGLALQGNNGQHAH
jgi:hypothetical protein